MVPVTFSAIVILALLSGAFYFVMRIRLMRANSARDRIEWLSFRSSDDVLDTYETLFPSSVLPRFCRFVFWMMVVFAAVALCGMVAVRLLGR
jgi:Na+/H+ antiporter NhaC